jgi:PAS domain S-box-containing protein
LEVEITKRNRQLLALQAAAEATTSGLDLQHILDAVTREMVNLLQMQACAIWVVDRGNRTLVLQACHGPEGWWTEERQAECQRLADSPLMEHVLMERRARCVRVDQPELAAGERARLERSGIQVVLYLPLVYQDSAPGLVGVMDDGQGPALTAEDIVLAQLLAHQAASAIENARLYDAIRRHIAEVTTLNKISQIITSILDLRETLAIIADHAHWLLDVAAASVILCDEERGDLWFGAASGEGSEFIRGKRLSRGQGIVNWVIRHGEPLIVPDTAQDPRFFDEWDKAMDYTTRSILCVPLKTKRQTIGAIEAINKASGPFDQEDLNLLTSIAASAAIAIENARLYRESQDHAANLEHTVAERTRELQAERDRTQAILEAVGEAVIVTDLEGRVRYLNPAAVALTGYTLQEALGRSSLWQDDQTPPQPREALPAVEDRSQTQRADVISRRKDGTLYDAAMTVAPLFDSQQPGRLVGHVCVQRDITPIKEAERVKDQFVSNVSHELRTPLSVIALISGNLDRLYERLPDEKRKDMVRDIREHAQVLTDLVGDVLEISRIESGQISMDRAKIDLAQLAREEVDRQLPLAQKQSQELQVRGVEHLLLWGNSDQLRLVVRNLLNNAIKYSPPRGRITCECTALTSEASEAAWPGSDGLPQGRWAALRVADTGIGISAEDLPQVFERFYRVKSQGNIPGTGLGLSIAKELVDSHGGHIAAASTLGQGSIFAIYLPMLED